MMVNLINNSFINYVNKEYQKINISETDKILKEEFKLFKKRKPSLVRCSHYEYLFQPIGNFHIYPCIK